MEPALNCYMQTLSFFILEQGTVSLLSLSKVRQPAQSLDQYGRWNVVKGVRNSKNITVALDFVVFLLGIIVSKICFLIYLFLSICMFSIQTIGVLSSCFSIRVTILYLSFLALKRSQDSQTRQESNKDSPTKILKCFAFPIL